MFRWLRPGSGSARQKVADAFRGRMTAIGGLPEKELHHVAASVALTWRDLQKEVASLDNFRRLPRPAQKRLIVKLADYEAECAENGPQAEAWAAELVSYFLAVVASHDTEDENFMKGPLERLARLAGKDFELV